MSIPIAGKIGGATLFVAGTPAVIYVVNNHLFLYEIEKEIISNSSNLVSSDVTNEATVEGETNIVKKFLIQKVSDHV